ncbi:hypothetical protein C2U72_01055 [Prosthecomicrobium hirschii]|uniref:hypothetical protein n=1 Tax=Prosthecodimorpha hirschii TaxID=665126 RepID=UPI00112A219F|nr:hypothetical protein [Prosthecomicrobium hirschii]TPQ52845.1 hypothetical protein C2U72_01055 [Prosthecomicrobium hirschii]
MPIRPSGRPAGTVRSLQEAIRRVREVATAKADSLADLAATERTRLHLLAEALADVARDIPPEVEFFTLAIPPTDPPRLWIDMTSHVALARDRRTYRFVKDTRLGRVVLRETAALDQMADAVTDYIAERLIEREQVFEADWLLARRRTGGRSTGERGTGELGTGEPGTGHGARAVPTSSEAAAPGPLPGRLSTLAAFAAGLALGIAALLAFAILRSG